MANAQKIYFPSKTFILGEYLVLCQGPSLILNTLPYFMADFTRRNPSPAFAPASPAGQIAQGRLPDWQDPHQGAGGFGASSAQFLALYYRQYPAIDDKKHLLDCFRKTLPKNTPFMASGADLLAQAQGGLVYCNPSQAHIQQISWPFPQHTLLVIPLPKQKIPTHDHLKNLNAIPDEALLQTFEHAWVSWQTQDAESFAHHLQRYATILRRAQLMHRATWELIETVNRLPGVLASKGCGALGADVMIVLCQTTHRHQIQYALQNRFGLRVLATHADLGFPKVTR